jgi:ABC-type branched-subunit amino acid transport system substrate-binding protein
MTQLDWFRSVGKKGNGAIGTLEFITSTDNLFTKNFVKKWNKEYGSPIISHEGGLGYDATRLLIDAIKRGGATQEGIRKALEETKTFTNLSGVMVKYTELREPELPIAIGAYNDSAKNFDLLEYATDISLIDPRPWYQYYK